MVHASNTNPFYLCCGYFNINCKVNIVFGSHNNQIEIQEILPNALSSLLSSPTLPPKAVLFYQDLENKHSRAIGVSAKLVESTAQDFETFVQGYNNENQNANNRLRHYCSHPPG